jgi:hypothetical protein
MLFIERVIGSTGRPSRYVVLRSGDWCSVWCSLRRLGPEAKIVGGASGCDEVALQISHGKPGQVPDGSDLLATKGWVFAKSTCPGSFSPASASRTCSANPRPLFVAKDRMIPELQCGILK